MDEPVPLQPVADRLPRTRRGIVVSPKRPSHVANDGIDPLRTVDRVAIARAWRQERRLARARPTGVKGSAGKARGAESSQSTTVNSTGKPSFSTVNTTSRISAVRARRGSRESASPALSSASGTYLREGVVEVLAATLLAAEAIGLAHGRKSARVNVLLPRPLSPTSMTRKERPARRHSASSCAVRPSDSMRRISAMVRSRRLPAGGVKKPCELLTNVEL